MQQWSASASGKCRSSFIKQMMQQLHYPAAAACRPGWCSRLQNRTLLTRTHLHRHASHHSVKSPHFNMHVQPIIMEEAGEIIYMDGHTSFILVLSVQAFLSLRYAQPVLLTAPSEWRVAIAPVHAAYSHAALLHVSAFLNEAWPPPDQVQPTMDRPEKHWTLPHCLSGTCFWGSACLTLGSAYLIVA